METRVDEIAPGIFRSPAALEPTTLALMHGSSFSGDGGAALRSLDRYDDVAASPA